MHAVKDILSKCDDPVAVRTFLDELDIDNSITAPTAVLNLLRRRLGMNLSQMGNNLRGANISIVLHSLLSDIDECVLEYTRDRECSVFLDKYVLANVNPVIKSPGIVDVMYNIPSDRSAVATVEVPALGLRNLILGYMLAIHHGSAK